MRTLSPRLGDQTQVISKEHPDAFRPALLGFAATLVFGSVAQAQAPAAPAAPAAAAAYSSASKVGDLIDNPAVKAALLKLIPEVINHPQLPGRARHGPAGPGAIRPGTDPAVFAQIDAELAKISKS